MAEPSRSPIPLSLDLPHPVRWSEDGDALLLLDQTLLPGEEKILRLETAGSVAEAVRSLRVRGAPAIGVAAAHGVALELKRMWRLAPDSTAEEASAAFRSVVDLMRGTRPTAVNLAWALERATRAFEASAGEGFGAQVEALVREADRILQEDRDMCQRIGEAGLDLIPEEGAGILTHCNAGALATGGIGTALAPIYLAHAAGIPVHVYADETRPLLQGARLTSWELCRAGVPVTVLTDSMAPALMKSGQVNLVMVGADRVAANGDVANKIGTYGLAVQARHHGIPFYVALPRSTFDAAVSTGGDIPIEVRDSSEVLAASWPAPCPRGPEAFNPAFDVTPAHLVTAFVTDGGLLRPPFETSIPSLLSSPRETGT